MNELAEIEVMTEEFGVFKPYSFFDLKEGDFFRYVGGVAAYRENFIFFCDSDCKNNSGGSVFNDTYVETIPLKPIEGNVFEIENTNKVSLVDIDFVNKQIKLGNFWFDIAQLEGNKNLLIYFISEPKQAEKSEVK